MNDAPKPAALIPGTEHCGGCAGVEPRTPQAIDNRGGLDAVQYRIGDYASFRDSLIAGLSSSDYAALGQLRTRDRDDWTIALLDAVACSADVLTFYQERIANESWLRTATERLSLEAQGKLIGYRLRPGVAAETALAFALEPPLTPPPGLKPDPGAFVTGIPEALTLEVGLKVQSLAGPGEKPQSFETTEAITARPEWNAVRPWLSASRLPVRGHVDVWLAGVALGLKPGDALVFAGPEFIDSPATNNNWDFRIVDSVEIDAANQRTLVRWKRGLGSIEPYMNPSKAPLVYALRRRAAVFGHNAPGWNTMTEKFRSLYVQSLPEKDPDKYADWPGFTISPAAASASGGPIDLDSPVPEIVVGSLVALAYGQFGQADGSDRYVELYKVAGTDEASRAEFAISGKVTRLDLSGQNLDGQFHSRVRQTRVHAVSELLPLAQAPVVDAVSGDDIPLAIAATGLEAGRRLIVRGQRVSDGAVIVHEASLLSVATDPLGCLLTITPALPAACKRETVIVHLNVARATHGESVTEILGSGNAAQAFQRFELKRLPLTYRAAGNELGARPEVTVRVGDVAWTEAASLYGLAAAERVYRLDTDEQGRQWLRFGDGVNGARLPSGVNNIRVRYRQGLGAAGNVRAETLSQLQTRPLGLKGVANPLAAEGGTDPEAASRARRTMPLVTRTLGRAVSLLDYEDFALAFTGIAKAQARVLTLGGGPTIAITLAGDNGVQLSATNPVWANLYAALRDSGDPNVRVQLLGYQASTFRLGLKVRRDPAYELKPLLAAVEAALRSAFSFDARALGRPVLQSEVIAAAHSVPGVVAIDLDFLYGGTQPYSQVFQSLQTRLLASRMRVEAGAAKPAELLSLHPGPLTRLEEMT